MDLKFLGDLRGGLDVLEGLNGNTGLELGIVPSSFSFHYQWFWFGGFTAPVHHYLSLAPGPNSGVHLIQNKNSSLLITHSAPKYVIGAVNFFDF